MGSEVYPLGKFVNFPHRIETDKINSSEVIPTTLQLMELLLVQRRLIFTLPHTEAVTTSFSMLLSERVIPLEPS